MHGEWLIAVSSSTCRRLRNQSPILFTSSTVCGTSVEHRRPNPPDLFAWIEVGTKFVESRSNWNTRWQMRGPEGSSIQIRCAQPVSFGVWHWGGLSPRRGRRSLGEPASAL